MKTLITLVLLTCASFSFAQHTSVQPDQKAQQKWVKKTISELKKDKSLSETKPAGQDVQTTADFVMLSYRIMGRTRIEFPSGEWIYFVPVSSHENPELGDICLAISNKGKAYVNYGHICGGEMVHYICKNCEQPQTSADFFRDFVSDVEDHPWKKAK